MNKEILKVIADNPSLLEATKSIILEQFDDKYDVRLPNERLGEVVRANENGKAKIESAFKKILEYKTKNKPQEKVNKAR